jgi:DNA modification methylase
MTKNVLYCGDNLEILATMEKESVDLIWMTKKGAFL